MASPTRSPSSAAPTGAITDSAPSPSFPLLFFEKREEECRKVILVPGAATPEAARDKVTALMNAPLQP
ncbi:Uncharacterized zinc-type alcohol dehydrogenase-like protein ybdR [Cronobacter muytjensii 530]